jgi:hypothetical protein
VGTLLRFFLFVLIARLLLSFVRLLARAASRRPVAQSPRAPERAAPRRPPLSDIVDAEFEDLGDRRS